MYKNKKTLFLKIILLFIIIICLGFICQETYSSVLHKIHQKKLSESVQKDYTKEKSAKEKDNTHTNEDSITSKDREILEQYQDLYAENRDIIGWLSIDGTPIDYPVMQCNDNDYYLHHDFYKKEDKYGCLFVKDIADVNTPETNFIIYGHNMKDGSMFGDLDLYKEETFYKEHSLISFHTLYEERTYEIISVFLSQVYDDEDVFKYYDFYQADTEDEFLEFYDNVKKMSLYDTGITAEYGDTFLTLSTCSYHVEDGRLAVVAKMVQ